MQDSLGEKQAALDSTIEKLMGLINDQAKENEERLKTLADSTVALSEGQASAKARQE